MLHPSLAADDKLVARFTREARAASRISHPHALTVTDFGEAEGGIVFLVMEYLRGRTLKQVIREDAPLPLARVVEITRQVCGALDAAHAEGVVHRDLKSDNIMLEEVGTAGGDWAKVLDFGIAKIQEPDRQDPELTAPNLIIGTPQYMSPEQCSQTSEIDARSDIYSLGIILYEMFTGHVPFTAESATTIMLRHLQDPPPSVLDERPDLPPAVAQVVARALSKQREDRQQSAGELSNELAQAATEDASATTNTASGLTGMAAGGVTGGQPALGTLNTNRIVVPTELRAATPTNINDEPDEVTIVRPPIGAHVLSPSPLPEVYDVPPTSDFNPWLILVPTAVLLVVIAGIFYAMERRSPAANTAPLTSDPNAVPVQAAAPPSGVGESGITTTTAAAPLALPLPTSVATPAGDLGGTASPLPAASPGDSGVITFDEPANANRNSNANRANNDNAGAANDNAAPETSPTPPANRNDNTQPRRQQQQPTPTPADANPTPLSPAPKKQPTPVLQPPASASPPPSAPDATAPPFI